MKKFGLIFLLTPIISFAMSYDDDIADRLEYEGEIVSVDSELFDSAPFFEEQYLDSAQAEEVTYADKIEGQEELSAAAGAEEAGLLEVQPVQQKRVNSSKIAPAPSAKSRVQDVRSQSDRPRVTHREVPEHQGLSQEESKIEGRKNRNDLVDERSDEIQSKGASNRPLKRHPSTQNHTTSLKRKDASQQAVAAERVEGKKSTNKQASSQVQSKQSRQQTPERARASKQQTAEGRQNKNNQSAVTSDPHAKAPPQLMQKKQRAVSSQEKMDSQANVKRKGKQVQAASTQRSGRGSREQAYQPSQKKRAVQQKRVEAQENEMQLTPKKGMKQRGTPQAQTPVQKAPLKQMQKKAPSRTTVYEKTDKTNKAAATQKKSASQSKGSVRSKNQASETLKKQRKVSEKEQLSDKSYHMGRRSAKQ